VEPNIVEETITTERESELFCEDCNALNNPFSKFSNKRLIKPKKTHNKRISVEDNPYEEEEEAESSLVSIVAAKHG